MSGLYAEIFPGGGQIWGTGKRGGAEAYMRCYTLHLLGVENDTGGGGGGGGNAPPLNTALYVRARAK